MEQSELETNVCVFAHENNVSPENVRVIKKSELVVGQTYNGVCRNADHAVWKGECFEYYRYKFGSWFKEEINHFEDDDGYDVFVPMEVVSAKDACI